MTQKKNLFSNLIWLVVAFIILDIYYFATTNFLKYGFGFSYVISSITTIISFVILIEIIVLFRFLINKNVRVNLTDNKVFVVTLSAISFILFIAVRAVLLESQRTLLEKHDVATRFFSNYFIGTNGTIFVSGNNLQDIQGTIVSGCFKFLGNSVNGVYTANFIFALIGFILTFFAIKILFGDMPAIVTGIGMASIPVFTGIELQNSYYLVEYAAFSLALLIVAIVKASQNKKIVYWVTLVFACMFLGVLTLYDIVCIGAVLTLLVLIIANGNISVPNRILSIIIAIIMMSIGFLGPNLISIIGNGNISSYIDCVYDTSRILYVGGFELANLNILYNNISIMSVALGAVIYLVAYWFDKNDNSYLTGILLVTTVLCCTYYKILSQYTYVYIIAVLLLVLIGDGLSRLLYVGESKEELYTVQRALQDNPVDDVSDDNSAEILGRMDWTKLAEARLIDYPEIEIEDEKKEVNLEMTGTVKKVNLTKKNQIIYSEFDYDVTEENMHFDI